MTRRRDNAHAAWPTVDRDVEEASPEGAEEERKRVDKPGRQVLNEHARSLLVFPARSEEPTREDSRCLDERAEGRDHEERDSDVEAPFGARCEKPIRGAPRFVRPLFDCGRPWGRAADTQRAARCVRPPRPSTKWRARTKPPPRPNHENCLPSLRYTRPADKASLSTPQNPGRFPSFTKIGCSEEATPNAVNTVMICERHPQNSARASHELRVRI